MIELIVFLLITLIKIMFSRGMCVLIVGWLIKDDLFLNGERDQLLRQHS